MIGAAILIGLILVIMYLRISVKMERNYHEMFDVGYSVMRNRIDYLRDYMRAANGKDEYNPHIVEKARALTLSKFMGNGVEYKYFIDGVNEAITEYHREWGAP
jgi:hypothetical protein